MPGSEIVGRVCALGAGVASLSVGDRVAGVTASRSGGYAEHCTIAADLVTRIDDGLDARRAVAVPNQGATALHVLETMARLKQGDVVAVTAAAGGVGGLAVQLARHLGAGTVVASSLFDALAPFGRLVSFGVASGMPLTVALHAMMKRSVSVSGFHLDAVMAVPGRFSATLARLYGLVDSGALTPVVGLEVPLERAAEAHAAMRSRTTMGKIVLSVGGVAGSEDRAARHHLTGRTG